MRPGTNSDDCREEQVVYTLLLAGSRDAGEATVVLVVVAKEKWLFDYSGTGYLARSANAIVTISPDTGSVDPRAVKVGETLLTDCDPFILTSSFIPFFFFSFFSDFFSG